jgi:tetratricopeptide (TPR) repeat protein
MRSWLVQTILKEEHRLMTLDDDSNNARALADFQSVEAVVLWKLGKAEEGERVARACTETFNNLLGPSSLEALGALSTLGSTLRSQGQLDESSKLLQGALDGLEALNPGTPRHSVLLRTLNQLGMCLQAAGKLEEALPLFVRALEGCTEAYGPDHRDTIEAQKAYGAVLQSLGRRDQALPVLRQSLARMEKALGKSHPDTLSAAAFLGVCCLQLGLLDEAEHNFRRGLEGNTEKLGGEHPRTLNAKGNVATVMIARGGEAAQEGIAIVEEVVAEMLAGVVTEGHPYIKKFRKILAEAREAPSQSTSETQTAPEVREFTEGKSSCCMLS